MSLETLIPSHPRDVQVEEIAPETMVLRSRTWDRLKFEIEYARQKGTTANSYVIKAEKIAIIDPPGESFTEIYLKQLEQHLSTSQIDYIIFGHVNANRMATLASFLPKAPKAKLVCSKPAANALKNAFPDWEGKIITVRSEDILNLGGGHCLQFMTIPTPRWADGLATYDRQSRILYTDKLFGVHVCDDNLFDDNWKKLDQDRKYYFDSLHANQAKQVEAALEKLATFAPKYYAPAHGPVVRYSLSRFSFDYRQWCQQQNTKELTVALLYASAYGNTATVARAIAQGLVENGLAVESINCEEADPVEITQAISKCDGFIIGSPTLGGHAPTQIQTALGIVLSAAAKNKLAGVFGSYGWSGEAVDLLEGRLKDANYRFGFDTIRVKFSPTEADLETCKKAGANFAQVLKKNKKLRTPRETSTQVKVDRTEQAISRIIGSLCVLSTKHGNIHNGFLTSWVSQATFNPPGLMLAVSQEQNADLLIQPGTAFVLNILKEGRNLRKHFSTKAAMGENPFIDLDTNTANNGCLILTEALAYLECTVQDRLEAGDRWLIYAVVDRGDLLDVNGMSAITHRKSGSDY